MEVPVTPVVSWGCAAEEPPDWLKLPQPAIMTAPAMAIKGRESRFDIGSLPWWALSSISLMAQH
jgi:hypothetical protein